MPSKAKNGFRGHGANVSSTLHLKSPARVLASPAVALILLAACGKGGSGVATPTSTAAPAGPSAVAAVPGPYRELFGQVQQPDW